MNVVTADVGEGARWPRTATDFLCDVRPPPKTGSAFVEANVRAGGVRRRLAQGALIIAWVTVTTQKRRTCTLDYLRPELSQVLTAAYVVNSPPTLGW